MTSDASRECLQSYLLRKPILLATAIAAFSATVGILGAAEALKPNSRDELRKSASWDWPDVAIYQQQLLSYLDQHAATDTLRGEVEDFWDRSQDQTLGPPLMDRLIDAAAMIEPRIKDLIRQLRSPGLPPVYPGELSWLTSDVPGWMQDTIRLACGRAFAQRRMYDEALETLSGLEYSQVCDPSSLFFYRAISEHHLLKKEECLANVQLLLERESELPARFAQVAQLMLADIQSLTPDSLDEVSRIMRDVHRRLDLGRAGQRVRDEEEEIVDKLDKLIEQLEQQVQQSQSPAQGGGASQPAQGNPLEESQNVGGGGPGDVDQKDIGERAGWGNLPPAERQQALQRLTEELPSHYRGVIEGYFRRLAKGKR